MQFSTRPFSLNALGYVCINTFQLKCHQGWICTGHWNRYSAYRTHPGGVTAQSPLGCVLLTLQTTEKHNARMLTYANSFPILFFLVSQMFLCLLLIAETKVTINVERSKTQNWTTHHRISIKVGNVAQLLAGAEAGGLEVRACPLPPLMFRKYT